MRFFWLAISLLLFLQPFAYAEINSSSAGEPPPAAPDVSTVIFAHAIFSNNTAVSNMPLVLLARANESDTVYRTFTDSTGLIILSLQKGGYEIDALLDMPSTPGMDFASTTSLRVPAEGNATLIFYPAGSLAGEVLSDGLPVAGAHVRVSCPSAAFDYGRINGAVAVQAGEAGDFMYSALPAGSCTVSASTDSLAGSSDVQIVRGQASRISIGMKKKAMPSAQDNPLLILLGLAAAAIIAAIAYLSARKAKSHPTSPPSPPLQEKSVEAKAAAPAKVRKKAAQPEEERGFDANSPKARAVLATLSEREREIVKFLFKCNGRAKRSQMQHKLLIPKTSLLRNLRSLERKNIVLLTPFGRNLLAELEQSLFQ